MNIKPAIIFSLFLLVSCNNSDIKVNTSKSNPKTISFRYVKQKIEGKINQFEYIESKTINSTLQEQIIDFDQKVRNEKDIKTIETVNGNPNIGIYQLTISQNDNRKSRYLLLNKTDLTVTFRGEIETKSGSYDAYLKLTEDLKTDFSTLISSLDTIINSSEVQTGEAC